MKRRKFFKNSILGVGGVMITSSCSSSDQNNEIIQKQELKIPKYVSEVKSNFSSSSNRIPSETVVVAQVGLGGWGNHFIQQLSKTGKNVFVKYICDVDDTRGGSAMVNI